MLWIQVQLIMAHWLDLLDVMFSITSACTTVLEALCFRAVCACVYTLRNCLSEFCHIYNSNAVGDKDELIRFWGQRSRSHRDHVWSNKHFGGILSPIPKMDWNILMKFVTITHTTPRDADIYKVIRWKVKFTSRQLFQKCTLLMEANQSTVHRRGPSSSPVRIMKTCFRVSVCLWICALCLWHGVVSRLYGDVQLKTCWQLRCRNLPALHRCGTSCQRACQRGKSLRRMCWESCRSTTSSDAR